MKKPIYITAIGSVSPLGNSPDTVWESYQNSEHYFRKRTFGDKDLWVAGLAELALKDIEDLKQSDSKYKDLDPSVLYALSASRQAIQQAQWQKGDNFGINIGSSRGATSLFEKYHQEFLEQNVSSTLSSPTTTLGNISSWIAHDLQAQGPDISHSITCSTALHALLNGVAWLQSGMCDKFLVGGSEAPLTPFTIAQMQALKIYSRLDDIYPNRSLDASKGENTMILGEGAAVACLETEYSNNTLAKIEGVGYATEVLTHNISVTDEAECFQKSMRMALENTSPEDVDVIVMHAPGTKKGDSSEVNAIGKVFGNHLPALTSNKWKIGHTFGASGLLSLEMAVLMLAHQEFVPIPYIESKTPKKINKILINAVGFGGNAVSVLISKP